jgi:hypothetical protein
MRRGTSDILVSGVGFALAGPSSGRFRIFVSLLLTLSVITALPSKAVSPAPVVTITPTSATITVGGSATFTASDDFKSGVTTYQWSKEGKIEGATKARYTISNATSADAGRYTVTVTNSKKNSIETATASAILTVTPPSTSMLSPSISPSSAIKFVGDSVTFTASSADLGEGSTTYAWHKDAKLVGSDAALTLEDLQTSDAGTYIVTVTVTKADQTSSSATASATLTVNEPGSGGGGGGGGNSKTPEVSAAVSANPVKIGDQVTFTASHDVPAKDDPTFQWLKDGSPIDGATNSTLVIVSATAADAGDYSVTVTDNKKNQTPASATSATITLTVNGPTPTAPTPPAEESSAPEETVTPDPGNSESDSTSEVTENSEEGDDSSSGEEVETTALPATRSSGIQVGKRQAGRTSISLNLPRKYGSTQITLRYRIVVDGEPQIVTMGTMILGQSGSGTFRTVRVLKRGGIVRVFSGLSKIAFFKIG